jgi:outer membrane protein assembly factor BamD
MGDPTMADPKPTLAPDIARKTQTDFADALNPNAKPAAPAAAAAGSTEAADAPAAAAPASTAPAAPLALQDVPASDGSGSTGSAVTTESTPAASSTGSSAGSSMGVEIVSPSSQPAADPAPAAPAAAPVADPNANGGLKAVGPTNNTPLPPIEKAASAPDQVNDVANTATPKGQAVPANGKKLKPEFDKNDESSSKHKKKKGIDKLNPF